MAAQAPGPDTQSSTEQGPQVSGPESETSVSHPVDLSLNLAPPIPPYNPYMLASQRAHYDPQGYVPGSGHGEAENVYAAPQEAHHGYQGHQQQPVQEQDPQRYTELAHQRHEYVQRGEGFVQGGGQPTVESRQVHRIVPRRLPHVRQRVRRRNRVNRAHVVRISSVPADTAYNNREHITATSITGSVTSGPILQTPVHIEGSQERLSRLTSVTTVVEESSSIGENFECNICFQKANEAVVTCCGHLFCWPCLYRWLHLHSYHKECPVCKGSIAEYSITPIYGRENALSSATMQGALGSERIPPRPTARRIESARQQREREEREREREAREAEARERTNLENMHSVIEHITTEIEEEPRAPGADAPPPETTLPRGHDTSHGGGEIALRIQDPEHDVQHMGRDVGEPPGHSQSGYLQRRMAFRREQLRQVLANSRYNASMNQNSRARGEERQQMMAATALLSQEWEHIINVSRLVVNPAQAAAWLASMHARLANMEGNVETNPDAANTQQRRQMIASAVTHLSQNPQEDSVSRLAVNPSQASDWITAMRTRLNNIEQIMHSLEPPIGGDYIPPWTSPAMENPNPPEFDDPQLDDLAPDALLAEINATTAPPPIASGSDHGANLVVVLDAAHENEGQAPRVAPEAHGATRRSRRRRDGEEASHVVSHHGDGETPHEDPLPFTHKRRRRD